MSDATTDDQQAAEDDGMTAELTKYGITRKTINVFFIGNYRYSNLRDAIAQAKRMTVEA
jgi:hypothetical protein